MAIWIRNQDKTSLIECKTISVITQLNGGYHIYANYIDFGEAENYDFLGKYSTKEKAIKALDMIQEHIVKHSNKVFKMPQDIIIINDDEVEV